MNHRLLLTVQGNTVRRFLRLCDKRTDDCERRVEHFLRMLSVRTAR